MPDLYFIPACCSSAIHSHNPLLLLLLPADKRACVCVDQRLDSTSCLQKVTRLIPDPVIPAAVPLSNTLSTTATGRRQNTKTNHETIKTSESAGRHVKVPVWRENAFVVAQHVYSLQMSRLLSQSPNPNISLYDIMPVCLRRGSVRKLWHNTCTMCQAWGAVQVFWWLE